MKEIQQKKSVIGPIISVFVIVMVISILVGLTFLFTASLKNNVITNIGLSTATINNESGFINSSGYQLSPGLLNPQTFTLTTAINGSSGAVIATTNYTMNTTGNVKNASNAATLWQNVNFTYSVNYNPRTAFDAINQTEAAGFTIVSYLSLVFLAVIFGAILAIVLRIITPYINLGNQFGGF